MQQQQLSIAQGEKQAIHAGWLSALCSSSELMHHELVPFLAVTCRSLSPLSSYVLHFFFLSHSVLYQPSAGNGYSSFLS